MSRSTFFLSRSRFLKSRFFSRDFDASRFLSRLSRRVEIVEICQDASRFLRFVKMQSRPFDSENDEKSRRIEKSRQENTKIHALLDRDKLSRNAEIFRSRRNSRSRSRFFGLDVDVETKSRYLDLNHRDLLFDAVQIFSTVETHSLTTSRSRVLIQTTLRQIETPKVIFISIQAEKVELKLLFFLFYSNSKIRVLPRNLFCSYKMC